MSRGVLLVPFPEVAPLVEPWLEHSVGPRPSQGIPAHVTLLTPCPPEIDDDVLAGVEAFDVTFGERSRNGSSSGFPNGLRTAGRSTRSSRTSRWRGCDARRGRGPDLRQRLPLHGRAREIALIVEAAPGRWESRVSYPLAGA